MYAVFVIIYMFKNTKQLTNQNELVNGLSTSMKHGSLSTTSHIGLGYVSDTNMLPTRSDTCQTRLGVSNIFFNFLNIGHSWIHPNTFLGDSEVEKSIILKERVVFSKEGCCIKVKP